jgi:hypothetical protein
MKYKIVNSSDNTEVGKVLEHAEMPPVLKVEGETLSWEGKEYSLVPDPVKETSEDGTMGLGILAVGLVIAVVAVVVLGKKK